MGEIALRTGNEQRALVLGRAVDHLAEHRFGVLRLPSDAERHGEDPQVLGLEDRVFELTVHREGSLRVPDGGLELAPGNPDLGQSREGLGLEHPVAQSLGLPQRRTGDPQRAVQLPLLPVGDPEIVLRLDDAAVIAGLFVRSDGAGVRPNRPAVVPLQVGDNAEVVGASADRDHIVVLHRLFLRPREEVRSLTDPAPLQRDRAAHVEGPHFQRPIAQHPCSQLRDHGPLLAQVNPTKSGMRDPTEQGEHGRLLELVRRALAQIGE